MTEYAEPDDNYNTAATYADTFARKFLALAQSGEVQEIVDRLQDGQTSDAGKRALDWMAQYLPMLVDAATHYLAVRDDEVLQGGAAGSDWIGRQELARLEGPLGDYFDKQAEDARTTVSDFMNANLISSKRKQSGDPFGDEHIGLFDIDFPAELIPSKTPGHFHLVLKRPVTEENYFKVLSAMYQAGWIQQGFYEGAKARGAAHIRAFPTASGFRNEVAMDNTEPPAVEAHAVASEKNHDDSVPEWLQAQSSTTLHPAPGASSRTAAMEQKCKCGHPYKHHDVMYSSQGTPMSAHDCTVMTANGRCDCEQFDTSDIQGPMGIPQHPRLKCMCGHWNHEHDSKVGEPFQGACSVMQGGPCTCMKFQEAIWDQ